MGAYLSEPDTEKHSQDENLENVRYGASSMQGWRATQEDAHNCIARFDDDTSLFAVYDGHGGSEVAQYCAMYLPDYVKSTAAYKKGNIAQALEDAFLGFDDTLTHANVISELKQMAGDCDRPSDTENEVNHLFAEANMPLDEVLAKYKNITSIKEENLPANPILAKLKKKGEDKPQSPFLRGKQGAGVNSHDKSDLKTIILECEEQKDEKVVNGDKETVADEKKNDTDNNLVGNGKEKTMRDDKKDENKKEEDGKSTKNSETTTNNEKEKTPSSSLDTSSSSVSSSSVQAGCSTGKRSRKTANVVLEDDGDDSSSSEDENYDGEIPYADSDSDKPESGEEGLDGEDEDDDEDDEDEDEEEEDDDDDEDEIDLMEEDDEKTCGCTAVVALLRGDELYVANAGDSRCIVCRKGKAIDMSVDHKPEDELEKKRVEKAGGKVTADGRVNGGLNLSRAIGDHTYKQNRELPAKEQMITALPDIRTLTIDPDEDEFMVLACDGIWNSMSSQEVADFVQDRIQKGTEKLSSICESLFNQCLATNTEGDGTGCDNMTAIIVKFNKDLHKFAAARVKRGPKSDEINAKRARTDEEVSEAVAAD